MIETPNDTPIVRIPPSPTGYLHIGTARTALFNYLFAKKYGGKVYLRIEDTDRERSKREYEENIVDGLAWLGITFDNKKPLRQSERGALYKKTLEVLLQKDLAYVSKEEPKKPGDRGEVIRFRNPNKKIFFSDAVRGEITFDTGELGDFVIAKSIDEPLYHLAVVADDIDMNITHVIRGEDHISNTPRQILLIEALGATRPIYAHIPLILAPDKSKLSKRHGATSLTDFRDEGYIKEAVINFLALLGWNPGTNQEIWSMEELIKTFDLSKVQKGGAVFNREKLDWFNKEYIKRLPEDEKLNRVEEALLNGLSGKRPEKDVLKRALSAILERTTTFGNITKDAENGAYTYLITTPPILRDKMLFKGEGDFEETAKHLTRVADLIRALSLFSIEDIKAAIMPYAEKEGKGAVLWPLRYSLTGLEKSPDPFTVIFILGKEESVRRLNEAVRVLSAP